MALYVKTIGVIQQQYVFPMKYQRIHKPKTLHFQLLMEYLADQQQFVQAFY